MLCRGAAILGAGTLMLCRCAAIFGAGALGSFIQGFSPEDTHTSSSANAHSIYDSKQKFSFSLHGNKKKIWTEFNHKENHFNFFYLNCATL